MLFGGMLAVWAVQRSRAIDAEGDVAARRRHDPRGALQRHADRVRVVCIFAYWAQWSAKRNDYPHTGLALAATAFMGLLILNAQFFVYHDMGLGIADGPTRRCSTRSPAPSLLSSSSACSSRSSPPSVSSVAATGDHEMLVAHTIYWYAITAVYCGIWFLVYVTK